MLNLLNIIGKKPVIISKMGFTKKFVALTVFSNKYAVNAAL